LRLNGATSGFSALKSPAIAGNVTWTLPNADGVAFQIIATDGAGNLTWASNGLSGLNAGNIWIGSAANVATPQAMSGDATISNGGYLGVTRLQGTSVNATAPTDAQQLVYSNALSKWTAVSMSGDATIAATGNLALKTMSPGVGFGTAYTKVLTDPNGRVTSGTTLATTDLPSLASLDIWVGSAGNAATAVAVSGDATIANSGYLGITRVQGQAVSATAGTNAQIWITNGTTWTPATLSGDATISNAGVVDVTRIQGTAVNTTAPTDAQQMVYSNALGKWTAVTITGDATMSATGSIALKTMSPGVGLGVAYTKVFTDGNGRVTSGSNPTTLAGYSITDAFAKGGNAFGMATTLGTTDLFTLNLRAGNTTAMTIDTIGEVGIGVAAPGQMLEVNGNVKATSFISTSDRRMKTNIHPSEGLELITKMNGVRYNWNSNGQADLGVIAQEIEGVLPEVVVTDPNSGMKAVKYTSLIAPLIESVKELDNMCKLARSDIEKLKAVTEDHARRITSVEDENARLKEKLDQVERQNKELRKRMDAIEKTIRKKISGLTEK
jgi:hypothetical protein